MMISKKGGLALRRTFPHRSAMDQLREARRLAVDDPKTTYFLDFFAAFFLTTFFLATFFLATIFQTPHVFFLTGLDKQRSFICPCIFSRD